MFKQWIIYCPVCGKRGDLYVISFRRAGRTIKKPTRLYSDGFIVDIVDIESPEKDFSTDQEKVRCMCCTTVFNLNELTEENNLGVEDVLSCPWDKLPLMVGIVSGKAAEVLETRLRHFQVYDRVRKSNRGLSLKNLKGKVRIAEILVKVGHLRKSNREGEVTYHV